jgi:hypothetical protein
MLLTLVVALGIAVACVQGLSVWLTGGQTVGKALLGLTERRVDGAKPPATLRDLAWAIGRHSWGYLVIDVLGVGVLAALVVPGRRCLHDLAFGSQVVYAGWDDRTTQAGWEVRGRTFVDDLKAGLERSRERFGWAFFLWAWLTKVVVGIATVVFAIARWVKPAAAGHLVRSVSSATTAPPATTLSTPASIGLWTGTAAVTAVTVVVIGVRVVSPAPAIVGTWEAAWGGSWRVEQTGRDSFTAIRLTTWTEPKTGCRFTAGGQDWRAHGRGPHYTGTLSWPHGVNGQNCIYRWAASTWDMIDDDTLMWCGVDPWDGHKECDPNPRRRTG